MTRLRRIENRDRFFFVTTNIARGKPALTPAESDVIVAVLLSQRQRGDFFLFGFVVMPTHVHLLFAPHNQNLIRIMRDLKSKAGYEISCMRSVRGPIWQDGYFDTIIRRVRNFWQKLEYIHRNPVEAALARNQED
jgi:putative transposase